MVSIMKICSGTFDKLNGDPVIGFRDLGKTPWRPSSVCVGRREKRAAAAALSLVVSEAMILPLQHW